MTRPLTPPRANGFTLIELMVALFVFGLLASAGLVLLRSSADGQAVLSERLGENGRMVRIATLMRQELAQALPNGGREAAFQTGDDALFAFTRAGQSGAEAIPPSRVTYRFAGGALTRRVGGGEAATVMDALSSAKVEFRDAAGQWQRAWKGATPTELPRAVRLTVTDKDGVVTQIAAAVGPQFRPVRVTSVPVEPPAEESAR